VNESYVGGRNANKTCFDWKWSSLANSRICNVNSPLSVRTVCMWTVSQNFECDDSGIITIVSCTDFPLDFKSFHFIDTNFKTFTTNRVSRNSYKCLRNTFILPTAPAGTSRQFSVWLQTGRPEFDPERGKGFLLYPLCPDQLSGPPSLLSDVYQGSFPRGKARLGVTLTTTI
jgi:hypothetical protein